MAKGMPLMIASEKAQVGPMVPVRPGLEVVRTEGMKKGDLVRIIGHWAGETRKMVLEMLDRDYAIRLDLDGCHYLQAIREGSGSSVHVWLE